MFVVRLEVVGIVAEILQTPMNAPLPCVVRILTQRKSVLLFLTNFPLYINERGELVWRIFSFPRQVWTAEAVRGNEKGTGQPVGHLCASGEGS